MLPVELLVVGFTSCAIGVVVVLFLAGRLSRSPASMASSGPAKEDPAEKKETQWKAEDPQPPWTVVGTRGNPRRTHPLYKKLAVISGEVNALTAAQVKERLEKLGLCKRGIDQVLSKRLKSHLRREVVLADPTAPGDIFSSTQTNPYGLDYLCVVDFEATCEAQNPPDYIHEIIEFPVILLSLKTLTVEDEFHYYCKPCLNPILTNFCKRLTGIQQDQVNRAPYFTEVFRRFTTWMEEKELNTTYKFALVTDCPWDIRECLFPQCVFARVPFPKYATKWIDMRKLFASFYQMKSGNLSKMLEYVGMKFEGREHCGLDDTRNITRVVIQMINDGCILKYNRFIPEDALNDFAVKEKR